MSYSEQLLLGSAALDYRYEGKQAPITPEQVINPAVGKITALIYGQPLIVFRKI